MRRAQLGMAMFLISESIFFVLLLLAFVYFRPPASQDLHLRMTSIYTALFLGSSFSVWRAASGSRVWLGVTIALGAAFLIGQGSEYLRLIDNGVTMSQGLFGTTFFTLAGAHGLNVLAALVALAAVPQSGVRVVAMYWTFLAAVWVAIFLTAYVWSAT
jgi:heme/copper-type cytochrome/quinol oxidase subunit 3